MILLLIPFPPACREPNSPVSNPLTTAPDMDESNSDEFDPDTFDRVEFNSDEFEPGGLLADEISKNGSAFSQYAGFPLGFEYGFVAVSNLP
ncbi:hypothetical protein [Paenibacillus lacisoli]|uniref:hypothetical protein n=1 Tax=Paenibacillus lacisoli TaxID=3064525 RepID=UPI002729FF2D|nr:hypothetical protein [Paenibacillus sp. JX-17]